MLIAKAAYYIKLGRGGEWADDSIAHARARIGWETTPLKQINGGEWPAIKKSLQAGAKTAGAGARDANALERFCSSTEDDIWVTFHDSKLWWGRLKTGPVKEDSTSKYRELLDGWRDQSQKKSSLLEYRIPGRISQLQRFQGTVCSVRDRDALLRLLSGEPSPEYLALDSSKNALEEATAQAIKSLHWKDFELLVDLAFCHSGWRRLSVVGEEVKAVDLVLEDPIAGDQYQVQVKSRATRGEAIKCKEDLRAPEFRRSYFVVHTPDQDLLGATDLNDEEFEVILPERLARMVVHVGLTGWLLDKVA